jgi:hypothetical protein
LSQMKNKFFLIWISEWNSLQQVWRKNVVLVIDATFNED